jgi:hypothetical protein
MKKATKMSPSTPETSPLDLNMKAQAPALLPMNAVNAGTEDYRDLSLRER